MSVYRNKGNRTWWISIYHGHKRYRKKSPINTKAGAREYEQSLRLRLAQGKPLDEPVATDIGSITLNEYSQKFLDGYVAVYNRHSEQYTKRLYLKRHLLPKLGHLCLDQISVRHIEEYKAEKLKEGQSPKSINNQIGVLGKCLRWAAELGDLKAVPPMKKLKENAPEIRYLSHDELSRLLMAVDDPMWNSMIVVASRTGLRFGELSGLQWDDVDLSERKITVRRSLVKGHAGPPKNGRVREVPLSADAVAALRRLSGGDSSPVFTLSGNPVSRSAAHRAITRYCELAGIKRIGWHALRHTCATQMANMDINLRKVQTILGHADIKMTERYTHISVESLLEAVNMLDGANAQAV
jgi:integrase